MRDWFKSGSPWIWLTAGAVAASVLAVAGVMALTALRGLGHFWPKAVAETTYTERDGSVINLIGELRDREEVAVRRLREAGFKIPGESPFAERVLVKMGNRDVTGADFRWFPLPLLGEMTYPKDVITIERREWGNFYGHLVAVKEAGQVVASGEAAWPELRKRFERANELFNRIYSIEKYDIGRVNYELEQLRLQARKLELKGQLTNDRKAEFETRREQLNGQFGKLQEQLNVLRQEIGRDTLVGRVMDGKEIEVKLSLVADVYRANDMGLFDKIGHYVKKLGEFIWDDPREANTEGGIFPAIFGTVLMVMLMAVMVTPLGIMAAIYMREYAKQGP
jgi:phosphate transport system permease protein